MSEPKLISPMLDHFIVGDAMSEHHGVRCYPALENETNDKYIVKVISIPPSQAQLDALLLSGAYTNKADALDYFRELADGVVREVNILESLSQLEGFIAYKDWQVDTAESGDGFNIYLLSSYKRSLQKHFKRHSFTHLDALNLGLDLCAALSVCRRSGYLYVNLKPGNVFVTDQRLFRIGDVGFVPLNDLKYASVPERYLSEYTPPEIRDAFSCLNTTMDTYAAGLILYQTYNNGALPFNDDVQPGDTLPAPMYADYEMSEIILKACAPNPDDRWQDPMEMGQAIISYMQRNGAMDTPIISSAESVPEVAADEATETEQPDNSDKISSEPEIPVDTSGDDEDGAEIQSDLSEETDEDEEIEELPETYETLTEEVSEILEQADELAAMDVPDPVIVPDHVDVPVPEPICEEAKEADEPESTEQEDSEDASDLQEADTEDTEENEDTDTQTQNGMNKRTWLRYAIAAAALLILLVGGFLFYKNYYLLPIEFIAVEGNEDTLTVLVTTDIDETLLRVVCSDTYGNRVYAPVVNGKAEFTGLVPNMAYSIKVTADGFHRLTGNASTAYSTPVQTNIVQFTAVTGTTEDSVILSFTVEGPDSDQWTVLYSAEGEEERSATFTSHMVTLTNLTVGKDYTFRLVSENALYVSGQDELIFKVRKLIKAENLEIVSSLDNTLTAEWSAPEGEQVDSWSVHCFNDSYSQTVITGDTTASFEGIDHTAGYTVEVKAVGMSVSQSTTSLPNSITAVNFSADTSDLTKITFNWQPSQPISEDGWLMRYSIVGIDSEATIACDTNTAVISPMIPGATYRVQLEDSKGNVLLGSKRIIKTPAPTDFSKEFDNFTGTRADLQFSICRTPKYKNWGRYDLSDDDYTDTFAIGQSASFLVQFQKLSNAKKDAVTILYIIRNQNNQPILTAVQESTWRDMWSTSYCKLNVPVMPAAAGAYTIEVYFNGGLAHSQPITITQ